MRISSNSKKILDKYFLSYDSREEIRQTYRYICRRHRARLRRVDKMIKEGFAGLGETVNYRLPKQKG